MITSLVFTVCLFLSTLGGTLAAVESQVITLTDVGLGPVPEFAPDRGTQEDWTLSSSCISINNQGEAACQTQAYGPVYGCKWRNAQKCSSKVKLVHKWNGNSLELVSSPDASYDVPLHMNDNGDICGYDYAGSVYGAGNGRIWWNGQASPETKESVVRYINNEGDHIVEYFSSPGGIASYGSKAVTAAGEDIVLAGVSTRPYVISNMGELAGAQILQAFRAENVHDPNSFEIDEVSGVGWYIDQDTVDNMPIKEDEGTLDVDGEILWPARYYRPSFMAPNYYTRVLDINNAGEILISYSFGGLVSSRICYKKPSTVRDIYGTTHPVPWTCKQDGYTGGTYAGGKVFQGMNNYGDIVGSFTPGVYSYQSSYASEPFVWLRTGTNGWLELNATQLVAPNSNGLKLTVINDINDSRQVVGNCQDASGQMRGCILDLLPWYPVSLSLRKPSCAIESPAPDSVVSGVVELSVAVSDRDGHVVQVVWKVDGQEVGVANNAPFLLDWDTSMVAPGTHEIKAVAKDNDNNNKSHKITVTVAAEETGGGGTDTGAGGGTDAGTGGGTDGTGGGTDTGTGGGGTGGATGTGEEAEDEGVIASIGTDSIALDGGLVITYDDSTNIKFNEVSTFAVGLNVQYKGEIMSDGSVHATDLEVN